jgi:hypothetical protein
MRKLLCQLMGCLIIATFSFNCLNAQTLEAEKSHALSKDAKKGNLESFNYDDAAKQYTLVFTREKNKETVYETMKFDYDFNLLSDNSETMSLTDASKKFDFVDYDEEKWADPVVIRVDAQAWGKGNVALRKGTISREWVKSSSTSNTSGNLIITTTVAGYWKYDFNEKEKVTPKIEMSVSDLISPKAPGFVRKMIENQAKKIYLVAYMTDEPSLNIQTGRRFFFPHAMATAFLTPKKAFSMASGDIVVVGKQVVAWDTNYLSRFVALKYSAADFSEKNRNMIEFRYGSDVMYQQELADHTIALFFAPLPKSYVKPGKPNPNSRAFTYIRVDKDANVKERIEFESPSSKWDINNIELSAEGDLYVYGPASQKNNDDYFAEQYNPKYDNFQFMKISGGKIAFNTSTKLKEFEKNLKFAPNMKKIDSYTGKNFEINSFIKSASGDIFINGQEMEGGGTAPKKYGNLHLLQFSTDGKLKAQYGYKLQETSKEAEANASVNSVFENPDNSTVSWLVYEVTGSTDEKALIYPRMATIDLAAASISDFNQFGYNKQEEFYSDNGRPLTIIDNNQKVVFFGADKKNKNIWFGRVKLGK